MLARQQGFVYQSQLPPSTNGVHPQTPTVDSPAYAVLSKLIAGKSESWPPMQQGSVAIVDTALDDLQREAVRRAIATPDIFLMHGLPGAGKSRVAAEIVLQTAMRGQRVLFLASDTASLDVVLQRLVGRSEVLALRCLDSTEKAESLPAWLRSMTVEEQTQAVHQKILNGARKNREQFEGACRLRSEQGTLWDELEACAMRCRAVESEITGKEALLAAAADDLAQESTGDTELATRLAELRNSRAGAAAEMNASLQAKQAALNAIRAEQEVRAARLAEIEPAYQAKKTGQFFTVAYWANLFNSQLIADVESLQADRARAAKAQDELATEISDLQNRLMEQKRELESACSALIAAQVEERRRRIQDELTATRSTQAACQVAWRKLCSQLQVGDLANTAEAIGSARTSWQAKRREDEQQCQFARQWSQFVEDKGDQLATRLPRLANVVAVSAQRWHSDAKLRESAGHSFDLVIVEDAENLSDADMTKAAAFGGRAAFVANVPVESAAPTTWNRLWHAAGGDAWRLPNAWRREAGKLVCDLVPVEPADVRHLETERLADADDIELHILHRPNTKPRLVQVRFDESTTFENAFTFMVREVQEFPLEPLGRTAWWEDGGPTAVLHFGAAPACIDGWIDVEPGVRLGTARQDANATPRVACAKFAKDRAIGRSWIAEKLHVCDPERTVFLQTPHRFPAGLARLVRAFLKPQDALVRTRAECLDASAEFVAVPRPNNGKWPESGAGLEFDLASRNGDRSLASLRQGLPSRGVVNLQEAQELVRRLEAFSQAPAKETCTRVGVLALHQGQVELLRKLVDQSAILRGRTFTIETGLPTRMRQREYDVVFLSLTRSHAQRATAFGDDILELPLALTRCCGKLFIFGDPGALQRRLEWKGPLDHLDAAASQQERQRLQHLVDHLRRQ
jgi:hypothetical protein